MQITDGQASTDLVHFSSDQAHKLQRKEIHFHDIPEFLNTTSRVIKTFRSVTPNSTSIHLHLQSNLASQLRTRIKNHIYKRNIKFSLTNTVRAFNIELVIFKV